MNPWEIAAISSDLKTKNWRTSMRDSRSISKAAVGLLGAALAIVATSAQASDAIASGADKPSAPYYFFCRSNFDVAKTFYFSTMQHSDGGVGREDLQNSFMNFLRTKYKYPHESSVSCIYATSGDMKARTESTRQDTISNLHAAQYEVVETDWKYKE
jgi:hypothetical protein